MYVNKKHVLCTVQHYWKGRVVSHIEIDTLEYQQTEKIETELEDVNRIRIRKVYACCPGGHSGGS
jgi:hypothetical protein